MYLIFDKTLSMKQHIFRLKKKIELPDNKVEEPNVEPKFLNVGISAHFLRSSHQRLPEINVTFSENPS